MPSKPPDPTGTGGPSSYPSPQEVREATVTAADGTIPLIYGTVRVGGKIFYVNAKSGYLYVALAFCEGPVHALTSSDITIDGETLTYCTTKLWIWQSEIKTGALDQTASTMLSSLFSYNQTHPGLCYVVLKIAGSAPWSSIPAVLATVQGTECYDPRDDSTAFTTNPALIVRDLMVRCGQLSATEDVDFDDASVGDAATYYAATVDGEPRYALNIAIISSTNLRAELGAIKAQCALDVYWDQGRFVFAPDKVLSSPIALTDAHLKDLTISRKDFSQTPNRVIVRWTNVTKDWVTDSATAETDELVAGTEDLVEASYDCAGITSLKTAQRHALYLLRRANFCSVTISGTLSPMAERLRRGDYITITNRTRLVDQGAIVVDARPAGNGEFAFSAEEYDANAYSTSTYVEDTPPSTELPDPFNPPPIVDDLTVTISEAAQGIYGVATWTKPYALKSELWGSSHWSATGYSNFDASKINDGDLTVDALVYDNASSDLALTFDAGAGRTPRFHSVRYEGHSTQGFIYLTHVEWSDNGSAWNEVTQWTNLRHIDPQSLVDGGCTKRLKAWVLPASGHRYWRARFGCTPVVGDSFTLHEFQFHEADADGSLALNITGYELWDYTNVSNPVLLTRIPADVTSFNVTAFLRASMNTTPPDGGTGWETYLGLKAYNGNIIQPDPSVTWASAHFAPGVINLPYAIAQDPAQSTTNQTAIVHVSAIKSASITATNLTSGKLPKAGSALTDSIITESGGNIGISQASPQTKLDVAGSVRATGLDTPPSGKCARMSYDTGNDYGDLVSYDFTGGVFKPLKLRGSPVSLEDGTNVFKFPSAIGAAGATPTGGIIMWPNATAPTGWLLCDGSSYSETTYAALFAVLGHNFGGDPGGGNFRVPDLRQKFPLGKAASGTGSTLGGTGGAIDHTHGMAHTHDVNIAAFDSGLPDANPGITASSGTQYFSSSGHKHSIDPPTTATTNQNYTDTDDANPPFLAVNWIIKT